ncbi:nucleophile aminohydrolase [Syncephalis plumigaleata]|nr:nucleophile aminohydrolase [Syncephalis plumigaleata]
MNSFVERFTSGSDLLSTHRKGLLSGNQEVLGQWDAAEEFAMPQFELPQCADPIAFLQRQTDDNLQEDCRIKIQHGTTTLAFKFAQGIIVAVDSRATAGAYICNTQSVKKVIEINPYYWRELGRRCRLYQLRNKERISILSNIVYSYKGMGLSMGTMITGWDKTGPALFYVDSDGLIFSVGSGSTFAYGVMDSGYDYDMSVADAIELGRRSIYHATHRDAYSGGVVNVYHVKQEGWEYKGRTDVNDLHYEYQDQAKSMHVPAYTL